MSTNAYEIVRLLEEHCGEKIKPTRLRSQIVMTLQDEITKRLELASKIGEVLNGASTFDPKLQKAIALSAREK